MSNIKWRTDFDSIKFRERCLCVRYDSGLNEIAVSVMAWCPESRVFFICEDEADYIGCEEVDAFITEQELIALFREQFRIQQPAGDKS